MIPDVNQSTTADTVPGAVIRFPGGLLGFQSFEEYTLATGPGHGLFWLISEDGGPTFLASDPFVFFDGYSLDLSPEQAGRIEAEELDDVAVLAITVPQAEGPWTANLQGPVVINVARSRGAQLVLPGAEARVRVPFTPVLAPLLQTA